MATAQSTIICPYTSKICPEVFLLPNVNVVVSPDLVTSCCLCIYPCVFNAWCMDMATCRSSLGPSCCSNTAVVHDLCTHLMLRVSWCCLLLADTLAGSSFVIVSMEYKLRLVWLRTISRECAHIVYVQCHVLE